MTTIDQFESVFKAAAKATFTAEEVIVASVLVVTDLEAYEARLFADRVEVFLSVLERSGVRWEVVAAEDYHSVGGLLELVERHRPDLVVGYRCLHSEAWRWPYTLGSELEVLTQVTTTPVLVMPHPRAAEGDLPTGRAGTVMALTDHLAGDDRLVNTAARFVADDGRLLLCHVEDGAVFERYMDVISKIAAIDTDTAREEILAQLLKEPGDYVRSCRQGLARSRPSLTVDELVVVGRQLREIQRLVEANGIDLVVLNTKDHDQLAMHGLAYPLAVELRSVPLLML